MNFDFKKRAAMLHDWEKSEACKTICAQEQKKYDQLLAKGRYYLQSIEHIMSEAKNKTVRIECAVGGNMHRGVYCPSPVLDLFVGGLNRGRILKRVTTASKIRHKFGFDKKDQLQFVEVISEADRQVVYTEYILRDKNKIFGITIDDAGYLSALSEERYIDGKIKEYVYAEMMPCMEDPLCFNLTTEEYQYDEQGLATCEWMGFDPLSNDIQRKLLCEFERRDGLLHAYTTTDLIWTQIDPQNTPTPVYIARFPRKAAGDSTGCGLGEP